MKYRNRKYRTQPLPETTPASNLIAGKEKEKTMKRSSTGSTPTQSKPAPASIEPLLLCVPEAAKAARISRAKLYLEIQAGRLAVKKIGRRTLITPEALRAWIAELPSELNPKTAA